MLEKREESIWRELMQHVANVVGCSLDIIAVRRREVQKLEMGN